MLSTILLIIFIPICILLILIVLLQAGKGGGLAGAFGGAGGQTFLGARGAADFLSKFTVYLAIAFMTIALILSLTYGTSRNTRLEEREEPPVAAEAAIPGDSATTQKESSAGAGQTQSTPADEASKTPSSEGNQ